MEGETNINMGTPAPTPSESSAGPIVATIIILAVIILGGLYFWGQRNSAGNDTTVPTPATTNQTNPTSTIESQSSSDTTSSIDADLTNTNTEGIDADIQSL